MILPPSIRDTVSQITAKLENRPGLASLFANCFVSTLETAVEPLEDGTTYVITGDIPAMWLRDSVAQVRPYLPMAARDPELRQILTGLIKRQMMYIGIDPYANAFNKLPDNNGHHADITAQNPWIFERKYEVDSLCYPVQLAYLFWKATGQNEIFDDTLKNGLHIILNLWKTEQNHPIASPYRFTRLNCPPHDTIHHDGMGASVKFTGMTWSGFRPSDDACTYGYHIPSNMFAVVVLGYIAEIAATVYRDSALAQTALTLRSEIDTGIQTHGIYHHKRYGPIYAYETDGFGNFLLMDDANIPSLLSIPYLGYVSTGDPVYRNTRRFILSKDNPYYYQGKFAQGIGSRHTPKQYIWHLALIMQALTTTDPTEIDGILLVLENTHARTRLMHEGFHADQPEEFTRLWFGWANSLLGELIYKLVMGDSTE